jgi:para-nitrobenzyl esterase
MGQQADVPLLAGWNSAEVTYHNLLGNDEPTPDNYKRALQKLYGDKTDEVLKFYPGTTNEEVIRSATDLASDRYIVYSTWKWLDLHSKTNGYPVYRYLYTHTLPPLKGDSNVRKAAPLGAPHSAELPFAFGNLRQVDLYEWTADDYKVSATMQAYFVNFIKSGDPNGEGLAKWSGLQASIPKVMLIDTNAHQEPEKNLKRYQFLDGFYYR